MASPPTARVPHPIPYQGSKRKLIPAILPWIQGRTRLLEPFAGSAAVTLAVAQNGHAEQFVIADVLQPLADLWQLILDDPDGLATAYEQLWTEQLDDPRAYYLDVRRRFNAEPQPALLLYLMARCVKNAIRFNPQGEFNQSADHRRKGTRPKTMRQNILGASQLLAGRTQVRCADFRDVLASAQPGDLVYMDPPYEGVSGRDARYAKQLRRDDLVQALAELNERKVDFVLSYDGSTGSRAYGDPLPRRLGMQQFAVHAGRSSQATLNGAKDETIESLYVSQGLQQLAPDDGEPVLVGQTQLTLFPVRSGQRAP